MEPGNGWGAAQRKESDSSDTEVVKPACTALRTMILLRWSILREEFSSELVKFDVLPRHLKG